MTLNDIKIWITFYALTICSLILNPTYTCYKIVNRHIMLNNIYCWITCYVKPHIMLNKICILKHTCILEHIPTHALTQTHTEPHIHTHIPGYIHTLIHTHIQTLSLSVFLSINLSLVLSLVHSITPKQSREGFGCEGGIQMSMTLVWYTEVWNKTLHSETEYNKVIVFTCCPVSVWHNPCFPRFCFSPTKSYLKICTTKRSVVQTFFLTEI